jgi:hypothetical protein
MRRRHITHPRFQFWFMLAFLRGAIISVGGGALLLFVALYLLAHDPSMRPEQTVALTAFMMKLGVVLLVIAVATLVLFALLGLYLSYKMAGPVRRLEDWLAQKNTAEGVAPLALRPGDEWILSVRLLNRLCGK